MNFLMKFSLKSFNTVKSIHICNKKPKIFIVILVDTLLIEILDRKIESKISLKIWICSFTLYLYKIHFINQYLTTIFRKLVQWKENPFFLDFGSILPLLQIQNKTVNSKRYMEKLHKHIQYSNGHKGYEQKISQLNGIFFH